MGANPGRGMSGNMRRLHLVEYSPERGGFILSARRGSRTGGYFLPADDALLELLREVEDVVEEEEVGPATEPALRPPARVAVESGLTPREIQARLRAGHSIEEVAAEAGVSTDWVDRWAAPVLAEQAAAVARAGQAVMHTPRRGPSDRTLDASVARNLAERGILLSADELSAAWSARHLADTDWLVSFRFKSRGRAMSAEWMINLANSALTARNRLGAELGFIEPGRRAPAPALTDPAAGGLLQTPLQRSAPARRATTRKAASRPQSTARKVAATGRATPTAKVAPARTAKAPPPRKAVVGRAVPPAKAAAPRKAAPPAKGAVARKAPPTATAAPPRKAALPARVAVARKSPPTAKAAPAKTPATAKVAASPKAPPTTKVAASPKASPTTKVAATRKAAAPPKRATGAKVVPAAPAAPTSPATERPPGAHYAKRRPAPTATRPPARSPAPAPARAPTPAPKPATPQAPPPVRPLRPLRPMDLGEPHEAMQPQLPLAHQEPAPRPPAVIPAPPAAGAGAGATATRAPSPAAGVTPRRPDRPLRAIRAARPLIDADPALSPPAAGPAPATGPTPGLPHTNGAPVTNGRDHGTRPDPPDSGTTRSGSPG